MIGLIKLKKSKKFIKMAQKFKFAGIEINNLARGEAIGKIERLINEDNPVYVVTPNAAHIVLLQKDKEFKEAYKKASLVLADGMSIFFVSKVLGVPLKDKCSGSDLFEEVCKICAKNNKSLFLLGGVKGSEKIAEQKLKQLYPSLGVFSYSPPRGFENDKEETKKIIDMVNNSQINVLIVCVGTPKSEKWLLKNIDKMQISLACSFGSSLDYFAGVKKRAPLLWQRFGLEWFWRFVQEPRRLWRRYLIGNAMFIWLVFKEILF
jgi:N-acetylglucosaminyldiphosphoundecaprenol N-acetyl-beta-D-mannosaminyltransferase